MRLGALRYRPHPPEKRSSVKSRTARGTNDSPPHPLPVRRGGRAGGGAYRERCVRLAHLWKTPQNGVSTLPLTLVSVFLVFAALRRIMAAVHDTPPDLRDVLARVTDLEGREVERNAEHLAMIDRLDRLYKRLAARQHRAATAHDAPGDANGDGVSPYAFRETIARQRGRNGL